MSSTFVAHWRWANGYSIIMGQRMFDHFLIHYLLTLLQMKQEGVAGLFKGVVPVMIRAFPANAVSEELRVNFICGLVVQQAHRLEFSDISGDRLSPKSPPPLPTTTVQDSILQYPFIHQGGKKHSNSKLSCPKHATW